MDNTIILFLLAMPVIFVASTIDALLNGPKGRNIAGLFLATFVIATMLGGGENHNSEGF